MREHPIPQDITGYRFHIIGSMTLKQFAEIGIGVAVAAIFYSTNLPAIVKWPFIGLSIGLGVAAAFLPIEERPLDHWIITFVRVLYKPTMFYWRRKPNVPSAFSYTPQANQAPLEPIIDLSPARRQRIKEYMGSVSKPGTEPYSLDDQEQARVAQVLATFQTQPTVSAAVVHPVAVDVEKPDLEVRVRKLRPQTEVTEENIVYAQTQSPPTTTNHLDTTPAVEQAPEPAVQFIDPKIQTASPPQPSLDVQVVQTEAAISPAPQTIPQTSTPITPTTIDVSQATTHHAAPATTMNQSVAYNTDLPFPSTPTEPNKVVGMVLTPSNDLVSDAIVEIQTTEGVVARAVKTNALGQFFITTPLADGEYTIVVERDGLSFAPQQLVLTNQIMQPIEIRSA